MEAAKEMGHFDEIEFGLLTEWFQYLEKDARTNLDLIGMTKYSDQIMILRFTVTYVKYISKHLPTFQWKG